MREALFVLCNNKPFSYKPMSPTVSQDRKEQANKLLSENALRMMQKRYLLVDENGVQETPADMFERVANALAQVEKNYGHEQGFIEEKTKEFFEVLTRKEFTPAGRTLTNAGAETPIVANCIVLPIHDSMDSIFQTLKDAALLQQAGSGLGFDFSELRPAGFPTKRSRGTAGGPICFLQAYDKCFGLIKQQGRTGANMAMLRIDHPDVLDFISCKEQEGEIRNFNISVTVTDEFMEALEKTPDKQWCCIFKGKQYKPRRVLRHPNGSVYGAKEVDISVKQLFDMLVEHAWLNGEPGIAFVDTWNKANPLPDLGPLSATNPCVTGDTLVSTEKGIMQMKALVEKYGGNEMGIAIDRRIPKLSMQMVQRVGVGSNGITQEVAPMLFLSFQEKGEAGNMVKAWKTGIKPVHRLITHSGYDLEATADHKIFTPQGKIPLSQLKKGDTILLQSSEGLWSNEYHLPFEFSNEVKGRNGRMYYYNFPHEWSQQLGQILGWLVGDGWLRDKPKQCAVGFTFSQENREALEQIKGILRPWYPSSSHKEIEGWNGVYHLIYGSKYFVQYFKNLGVKTVKAQEKEVPHALWMAPREAVIGFLQGLFSANGTIQIFEKNQTRHIRLISKSRKLLGQAQLLLLNLGIRSTLYNRSRKPSVKLGYQSDGVCFELQISKANVRPFLEKVGFLGNHYTPRAETLKQKDYYAETFEDRVQEIVFVGEKEVYDLTEEFSHSFIANGIVVSNCGEQTLHPYDNCNLGSINLASFVKDREIDWERLRFATRTATRMLDNVIDKFDFPVPAVNDMAKMNRRIGLGIMGFADMLYQLGVRYDSEQGLATAEKVMSFVNEQAYLMSRELAEEKGVFLNYPKSVFAKNTAHSAAQESGIGKKMRNAALTTVAPTGSISMMFDCSSGIEPNFALFYTKQDKDGQQYHYFNKYFEQALNALKLEEEEKAKIMKTILETGSVQKIKNLPQEIRDTFVISMDISGEYHMRMQAAFQKQVDNSISKTINFPNTATKEEVAQSFIMAWKLGCKSCTVYREGSRMIQILNVGNGENIVAPTEAPSKKQADQVPSQKVLPRKRPEVMEGKTYRMRTGYGNLYVTINNDEKGEPFEVFATIGKSGGFFQEQSEAMCRLTSLALRAGIPVPEVVKQLKGIRGPMPIFTEKGTVLSLPDAIGRMLEEHATVMKEVQEVLDRPEKQKVLPFEGSEAEKMSLAELGFMPGCPECGFQLVVSEGCISCKSCGFNRCS